jgi:hypothetical protein
MNGDDERRHLWRPGYHDPTYEMAGAAPARSALTLRLVLATFGFLSCSALAIWAYADDSIVLAGVMIVLGVVAAVDIAIVVRRKRRGEPG